MTDDMRPLWQILIAATESQGSLELNCDECFLVMEYMVEQAISGADQLFLHQIVTQHINNCPKCRDHHLKRIRDIEENGWLNA